MTEGSVEVGLSGERLIVDPDRALIWPAQGTAFIADLHLGKGEIFRRAGIPIPEGTTQTDLQRITRLTADHGLQRVVLLGDFLHGASKGRATICRCSVNGAPSIPGSNSSSLQVTTIVVLQAVSSLTACNGRRKATCSAPLPAATIRLRSKRGMC